MKDELQQQLNARYSAPSAISSYTQLDSLLSGGAPEVSVFWTDDRGIKCKARFDYLKSADFADFKTFANSMRKDVQKCIADAIAYDRIYIQVAFYWEASEAIRLGGLDIKGFAREDVAQQKARPRPRQFGIECRHPDRFSCSCRPEPWPHCGSRTARLRECGCRGCCSCGCCCRS